ncbi:MAG: DUF308 domain-containing protein [Bacteroidetes bacterium]|nr:DUF308 domain-containing protein [Bacteroidota bacterium]
MTTLVNSIKHEIKNWWWFLIVGLISLATGIIIFANPAATYIGLSFLFSLIMAGTGLSQIVFAVSERHSMKNWGWTLVSGILDFALGTFLMIFPFITMATLPFFVGFYLLFRGIYLIGASIELNSIGIKGWGWVLIGGIILFALAFLTLYYPAIGALGIITYSGYAFIVSGIFSIVLALQLRAVKSDIKKFEAGIESRITGTFQKEIGHA